MNRDEHSRRSIVRDLVSYGVVLFGLYLMISGGLPRRIGLLAAAIFFGSAVLLLMLAAWATRRNLARLRRLLPARIQVVQGDEPPWRDPAEVARLAGALRPLGFRDVGYYNVKELPGTRILVLDQPEQSVRAQVLEQPGATRPILRLTLRYDNGSSLTYSNSSFLIGLPRPPRTSFKGWPGLDPELLYRRLLTDRPADAQPIPPGDFAPRMEQTQADFHDWLMARGGYTATEIQANQLANGRRCRASVAKAHADLWRRLAAERRGAVLDRILGLLEQAADPPPDLWEQIRGDLIIIHDGLTAVEAVAAFNLAHRGAAHAEGDPTPWIEPRAVFAHLNRGLPNGRRLLKVASITDPIAADAYLPSDVLAKREFASI